MASATPTTVTVSFNPTAINIQTDVIGPATANGAGVLTASLFLLLESLSGLITGGFGPKIYDNASRPAPNDPMFAATLADGRVAVIWNSSDNQPNYSDGANWYDADGNLT